MNGRAKWTFVAMATLTLGMALAFTRTSGQAVPAQAPAAGAAPKTAGEAFKNIQVLKDIPSDELFPAMQFISASLGVECEYCHVEHAFDKDDKPPKLAARKMMVMMFAINKENFAGRREVTCYSCHRGATEPTGIPAIPEQEPKPEMGEAHEGGAAAAGLPTADQLLGKYVQAAGGSAAIEKITSRVEQGKITIPNGAQFPIEIYAKAPFMRLSVMHTPRGENATGYDGQAGWMSGMGRPARLMTGPELDPMRLDADFYFPAHAKQAFAKFRLGGAEKVDGQDAYAVFAFTQGKAPAKMYFDKQSGLLVRLVQYTESPLGLLPAQIDYADYREVDGVKVPFRWTLARTRGRFTIQVEKVEQNVPIDDAKFALPAAPATAEQKPANQ
ncbi:MAG: c-type cytochrome [Acidobacteriia bacterium]|nr:c-type cytochrome [Terriglobia bacterium]